MVLAQVSTADLDKLPYDILAKASRLTFGLAELFPKLNGAVVSTLEPADLDALYDAQARYATEALGEVATKKFALRHPCLFPYRLPYLAASELVARSRRLEALRQGLDEEALILRSL